MVKVSEIIVIISTSLFLARLFLFIIIGIRILPELGNIIIMCISDVFPDFLSQCSKTFSIDLGEILPSSAVFPGFVHQILYFNQNSQEEAWGDAILFLGNDWLCLVKVLLQLLKRGQHLIEILRFLA